MSKVEEGPILKAAINLAVIGLKLTVICHKSITAALETAINELGGNPGQGKQ